MTDRESEVPLDLKHALDDTQSGSSSLQGLTEALRVYPGENHPNCPECGDRLSMTAVSVDHDDNPVVARFVCHSDMSIYVEDVPADELYYGGEPEVKRVDIPDDYGED